MMFVEWFIWGAWFVPLWLWLSKSGFSAEKLAGRMPVPPLRRSCRQFWLAPSLTAFLGAKVLAVLMFAGALLMYFAAQQTTLPGSSRYCWPTR